MVGAFVVALGERDGDADGEREGLVEGEVLGLALGLGLGLELGLALGPVLGERVGSAVVGCKDGDRDGLALGLALGLVDGLLEGDSVGLELGLLDRRSASNRDPLRNPIAKVWPCSAVIAPRTLNSRPPFCKDSRSCSTMRRAMFSGVAPSPEACSAPKRAARIAAEFGVTVTTASTPSSPTHCGVVSLGKLKPT